MPSSLGTPATSIFLQGFSNHFTHVEFEAAVAVFKGQPVKLTALGLVTPYLTADGTEKLIGVAHADAAIGELVTVCTRGLGVVFAEGHTSTAAGPVHVLSYTTGTKKVRYTAATNTTDTDGWALDAATTAGDGIRVLIAM
jgi:hypothetical protein